MKLEKVHIMFNDKKTLIHKKFEYFSSVKTIDIHLIKKYLDF
jgi:hypothetical protein